MDNNINNPRFYFYNGGKMICAANIASVRKNAPGLTGTEYHMNEHENVAHAVHQGCIGYLTTRSLTLDQWTRVLQIADDIKSEVLKTIVKRSMKNQGLSV